MVQDRQTHVGCAAVQFRKGANYYFYWVCNYAIRNVRGRKVYATGKPFSKCKLGRNMDFPSLCRPEEPIEAVPHEPSSTDLVPSSRTTNLNRRRNRRTRRKRRNNGRRRNNKKRRSRRRKGRKNVQKVRRRKSKKQRKQKQLKTSGESDEDLVDLTSKKQQGLEVETGLDAGLHAGLEAKPDVGLNAGLEAEPDAGLDEGLDV